MVGLRAYIFTSLITRSPGCSKFESYMKLNDLGQSSGLSNRLWTTISNDILQTMTINYFNCAMSARDFRYISTSLMGSTEDICNFEGILFSTGLISIRVDFVRDMTIPQSCIPSVKIPAATSHSSWNPVLVPAPTFEERFGLRLRPTAPEQPLGPLYVKQGSSKRIFSSRTLDLDHGCL